LGAPRAVACSPLSAIQSVVDLTASASGEQFLVKRGGGDRR
jgi:hypothetical protein